MQNIEHTLTKGDLDDPFKKTKNKSTESLASILSLNGRKKKRAKSLDELKASIESIKRAISFEKKVARSRSTSPPSKSEWEYCQDSKISPILSPLLITSASPTKDVQSQSESVKEQALDSIQNENASENTQKEDSIRDDLFINSTNEKEKAKKILECNCKLQHAQMKNMLDHTFQVSIDSLWNILFGSALHKSDFCRLFWEEKLKYKNIKFSKWHSKDADEPILDPSNEMDKKETLLSQIENGWQRQLEYTVPSSNPIGKLFIKTHKICK